jgi:hypothetical protein
LPVYLSTRLCVCLSSRLSLMNCFAEMKTGINSMMSASADRISGSISLHLQQHTTFCLCHLASHAPTKSIICLLTFDVVGTIIQLFCLLRLSLFYLST